MEGNTKSMFVSDDKREVSATTLKTLLPVAV